MATLPKEFADYLVIIEQVDESEVRIRKAPSIPVEESWLWKNRRAGGKVLLGLQEAQAGQFVDGPDLDADAARFGADEDATDTP